MVDFSQGGKQPQNKLLLRHFQAEQQSRHPVLAQHCRLDNRQRQRGLAQRRAPGHDDQVPVLQARGQIVEVGQPGGHAGDRLAAALELAQPIDQLRAESLAHAQVFQIALVTVLIDPEYLLLRFLQQFLRFPAAGLQDHPGDPLPRARQPAPDGHVADDSGIGLDIGRARRADQKIADIAGAAGVIELLAGTQMLADSQIVAVLAVMDEIADRAVDQPVVLAGEIAAGQQIRHVVPGLVIQHEAAEQGALGIRG